MTQSTMTFRRYLVLAVVTLTSAFGDTLLSRGMKELGPVSIHHPAELIHAVLTPWVGSRHRSPHRILRLVPDRAFLG